VQRTLDAFTGGMALVRNRRWDYLAANALGRAVYAEIFDGRTGPPNHVRYVFLDDRARSFFDDWPAVAHDTARILRSEAARDQIDNRIGLGRGIEPAAGDHRRGEDPARTASEENEPVKPDIHPKYYEAKVHCGSCGTEWTVGSTREELRVDVCANCHPFFTGKQTIIDTAGQVERFQKRLERQVRT